MHIDPQKITKVLEQHAFNEAYFVLPRWVKLGLVDVVNNDTSLCFLK